MTSYVCAADPDATSTPPSPPWRETIEEQHMRHWRALEPPGTLDETP